MIMYVVHQKSLVVFDFLPFLSLKEIPALVVGCNVVPSWLDLVSAGPEEVSLNCVVPDVHRASSKDLDVVIGESVTVSGACSVLDVGSVTSTVWSQDVGCSVEVNSDIIREVVVVCWALNSGASVITSVVETSKPMGAWLGGEGPLTNPDWVLNIPAWVELSSKDVTVLPDLILVSSPCEVLMGVHDNILHVIIIEEVIPDIGVVVE